MRAAKEDPFRVGGRGRERGGEGRRSPPARGGQVGRTGLPHDRRVRREAVKGSRRPVLKSEIHIRMTSMRALIGPLVAIVASTSPRAPSASELRAILGGVLERARSVPGYLPDSQVLKTRP